MPEESLNAHRVHMDRRLALRIMQKIESLKDIMMMYLDQMEDLSSQMDELSDQMDELSDNADKIEEKTSELQDRVDNIVNMIESGIPDFPIDLESSDDIPF